MAAINDLVFFSFLIEGYKVSDQITKAADADIVYYGYLNKYGEWYIMEWDTTAGANNLQTYRFAKGDSGYATNWINRESLTYDTFDQIFK